MESVLPKKSEKSTDIQLLHRLPVPDKMPSFQYNNLHKNSSKTPALQKESSKACVPAQYLSGTENEKSTNKVKTQKRIPISYALFFVKEQKSDDEQVLT